MDVIGLETATGNEGTEEYGFQLSEHTYQMVDRASQEVVEVNCQLEENFVLSEEETADDCGHSTPIQSGSGTTPSSRKRKRTDLDDLNSVTEKVNIATALERLAAAQEANNTVSSCIQQELIGTNRQLLEMFANKL